MKRDGWGGRAAIGRKRLTDSRQRFDQIYLTLRMRICLLDYPPGMRLTEDDLAEEFQTSRTPIRRVLARLEDEGMLLSVHGVGTIVTDIDLDELAQVYRLRIELAELVGRLDPVTPDETTIAAFRRVLARCDELVANPDARGFAEINMDFFQLLNGLSANEPFRAISERLYYQTSRMWLTNAARFGHYEEMLRTEIAIFRREVADIVAAIELGDLATVGHIRRSHIAMSFARLTAQAQSDDQSP
jgi:DNA-binding GntR family transcriptional regulator